MFETIVAILLHLFSCRYLALVQRQIIFQHISWRRMKLPFSHSYKEPPELYSQLFLKPGMDADIVFQNRLNKNNLQSDLGGLPATILSALSAFDEAFILLDTRFVIAFVNGRANEILKKVSGYFFETGESILNLLPREQQLELKN